MSLMQHFLDVVKLFIQTGEKENIRGTIAAMAVALALLIVKTSKVSGVYFNEEEISAIVRAGKNKTLTHKSIIDAIDGTTTGSQCECMEMAVDENVICPNCNRIMSRFDDYVACQTTSCDLCGIKWGFKRGVPTLTLQRVCEKVHD